jgi:tRNA (guanine-N7-)-methyltransferase
MKHFNQPTREEVVGDLFPLKGKNADFFKNDNPVVLELGCGEYLCWSSRKIS